MLKVIVSIFLTVFIFSGFSKSEASEQSMGLRCFDLFSENTVTKPKASAPYYAEALDVLNKKYNNFIFKENLLEVVEPNLENLSFSQNIKARYQARKLKKILIDLHNLDQVLNSRAQNKNYKSQIYDLEKIATNIEKISFIIDDSQTQNMSRADQIVFKQVQHSLLTQGLSEFLFTKNIQISPSKLQTIKTQILAPFKKVYLRWILSPLMMPHLDGAVIPYEVIEKVIWEGYDNSKDLLAPYLKTAQGKYTFNIFSSTYNYLITGLIVVSTVMWIQTTTLETYAAYNHGVANAEAMLKPALENAKSLATKNLSQEFRSDTLQISIEKFKEQFHREPTVHEVELIQQLIIASETPK